MHPRLAPFFKRAISTLILLFAVNIMLFPSTVGALLTTNQAELSTILGKAADYCERLKSISLHFICVEEVNEKIFHPYAARERRNTIHNWRIEENRYVYDYQLFQRKEVEEIRTLLESNGKRQQQKDVLLDTKRFEYKNVVLGPIGLFSKRSQPHYNYTIEDVGKLWGSRIVIVSVEPKPLAETASLFGKAWIDRSNGSILKIEWEEASIDSYQDMVEFAESLRAKPRLYFYSDYRFEKNGIRFPSTYIMKENYVTDIHVQMGFRIVEKTDLLEKSELRVEYKDYHFFIVETEVKY